MAELRLEHIYKTYKGGVEAVKDLNLTVANGEFLALLGPSGCGKTSTLRMIVGLEEITRGDMYIGSRRAQSQMPWTRISAETRWVISGCRAAVIARRRGVNATGTPCTAAVTTGDPSRTSRTTATTRSGVSSRWRR